MKRKYFYFAVIFAFVLPCLLFLTACGDKENKVYVTIDQTPEHVTSCSITASDGTNNDSHGTYVKKGNEVEIVVSLDSGYNLGDLVLSINGTAQSLLPYSQNVYNTSYKTSYIANEDMHLTFSGKPALTYSNLELSYSNIYIDPTTSEGQEFENNCYIRFDENYASYGLAKQQYSLTEIRHFSNTHRKLTHVPADRYLTFEVIEPAYSLGLEAHAYYRYGENPNDYHGILDHAYVDEDKVGYLYAVQPITNGKIEIDVRKHDGIDVSLHGLEYESLSNKNNLYSVSYNGIILEDGGQPVPFDAIHEDKITIGFTFHCDQTTFDAITEQLTFTLGVKNIPITFTKQDRTITFEVSSPYHYASTDYSEYLDQQYFYQYYITTNLLDILQEKNLVCTFQSQYDLYLDGENRDTQYLPECTLYFASCIAYEHNEIAQKNSMLYDLPTSLLSLTINIAPTDACHYLRLGTTTIDLENNTNDSISVVKVEDQNIVQYQITLQAGIHFDKVELLSTL